MQSQDKTNSHHTMTLWLLEVAPLVVTRYKSVQNMPYFSSYLSLLDDQMLDTEYSSSSLTEYFLALSSYCWYVELNTVYASCLL